MIYLQLRLNWCTCELFSVSLCEKGNFQYINVLKLYLYFEVCMDKSSLVCQQASYLFNVQEVFGFKGYGHALHGNVIAGAGVVTNVCPHSKRHWFGLEQ